MRLRGDWGEAAGARRFYGSDSHDAKVIKGRSQRLQAIVGHEACSLILAWGKLGGDSGTSLRAGQPHSKRRALEPLPCPDCLEPEPVSCLLPRGVLDLSRLVLEPDLLRDLDLDQ